MSGQHAHNLRHLINTKSVLIFLTCLAAVSSTFAYGTLEGVVYVQSYKNYTNLNVIVQAFSCAVDQHGNPSFAWTQIYSYPPVAQEYFPLSRSGNFFDFQIKLPSNKYYALFAFLDTRNNGKLDLEQAEPLGWYTTQTSGPFVPVLVKENGISANLTITLKASHPYDYHFTKRVEHVLGLNASLTLVKGFNVMHLKGDPAARGYAHGALAGKQILDWFRFYLLEQTVKSASFYTTNYVPFLQQNFTMDPDFKIEAEAMIRGMKDSGVDIYVEEIGREFSTIDILGINAYIELGGCSQFVAWGAQTHSQQTIAARNMDGEIEPRKITVSHLTMFLIDPSQEEISQGRKRYVSIMWPGFIGTLTGINEYGLYGMMDTGHTYDGPSVHNLRPVSWALREALFSLKPEEAQPNVTLHVMNKFKSTGGGISFSGAILVFARPSNRLFETTAINTPGYVFEGDKYFGLMRLPAQVDPIQDNCIMATNHFFIYGADPFNPDLNFGQQISFSSKYRYYTGMMAIQSWNRTNQLITPELARQWLQRVCHGSTEHSVIYTPVYDSHSQRTEVVFHVANANMHASQWDAPYQQFKTFTFTELFEYPLKKLRNNSSYTF